MKTTYFILLLTLLFGVACTPKNAPLTKHHSKEEMDARTKVDSISLDIKKEEEAAIKAQQNYLYNAEKYPYQPTRTRKIDILHTKIELSFDWANRHALGKAILTIKPYFYPTSEIELDAQSFDIQKVAIKNGNEWKDLTYKYEDKVLLKIQLDRTYKSNEEYQILIAYTAKPYEREAGGGTAVTSDRGLFFINHDNSDPTKPQQIWTQGETNFSSCWFPTFDSPNEKCTEELSLTVDNKFVTIANGKKISATQNADGTRTDYWKQDKPHSPYLFAFAVGDFVETKDTWRGKEVNYYLERKYGQYGKAIFGNTPEMLEFFSNRLGVEYPWDKYSQVVVREFVSGAMENTTCTIFFDTMNEDDHELLDEDHEDIIAHELFHHWFGDLVTCENYGNLTLNEGFASYSEYLWFEHKYGKDAADYHLIEDLADYLGEAAYKQAPIVRSNYRNADDLFDAHSYQKGACVLHTLRSYVGDSAFFLTLKNYLQKYAYQNVELADLREEFERTTGEDLNWFFNQWFLSPGHPELSYTYKMENQKIALNVSQMQELIGGIPMFRLPLKVQAIDINGKSDFYNIEVNNADSTYYLPYSGKLGNLILDCDGTLLGTIQQSKNEAEMMLQARYATNVRHRLGAVEYLGRNCNSDECLEIIKRALKDPFHKVREEAVSALNHYEGTRKREFLRECLRLAITDPKSAVRAEAMRAFANKDVQTFAKERGLSEQVDSMLKMGMVDKSYVVQAAALDILLEWNNAEALKMAVMLCESTSSTLKLMGVRVLMEQEKSADADKICETIAKITETSDKYIAIHNYLPRYLKKVDETGKTKGVRLLVDIADKEGDWWIRNAAVLVLRDYMDRFEVKELINRKANLEPNEQLREMYMEMKREVNK